MKIDELMIGDLVQYTSDQWLTNEDALPLKVTCVGEPKYPDFYPYIRIEDRNENYHIDLFQPIPITPEILENNGFTRYGQVYANLQQWVGKFGDKRKSLVQDIRTGKWGMNDVWIDYVHELQHALKLCRIDKELIL